MTTTAQHMNARNDGDLMARFIAKAEMMGLDTPSTFIQTNMSKLVTRPVDGAQTVADVHAYAAETRQAYVQATPPAPGANLGAVTDAHIESSITAVQALLAAPE